MMKRLLTAIFIAFSFCAFGVQNNRFHVTGTYVGMTEKYIELKTPSNSILVPKELVPKQQFKSNGVIEIDVSKADLDRIKIKH